MIAVKETGIIMSGDHPKLILDGHKTQTRKVIVPQPELDYAIWSYIRPARTRPHATCTIDWSDMVYPPKELLTYCPYGQVGDRLWVRETALYWVSPIQKGVEYDKPSGWWSDCVYKGDSEIPHFLADNQNLRLERDINTIVEGNPIIGKWEWKPSIHMTKYYSRITLEITEVRVERLQEITPLDCLKEGINLDTDMFPTINPEDKYRRRFELLWDSLNAKRGYGWEANPWVWAIGFKVV